MYDCDKDTLNNVQKLEEILLHAAKLANCTIINSFFYHFTPQGVSGTVVIAESHLNIHTWPEYNYAAIDLFTCGVDLNPDPAIAYILDKTDANRHVIKTLERGNHLKTVGDDE